LTFFLFKDTCQNSSRIAAVSEFRGRRPTAKVTTGYAWMRKYREGESLKRLNADF
jgi:hypothetical protein